MGLFGKAKSKLKAKVHEVQEAGKESAAERRKMRDLEKEAYNRTKKEETMKAVHARGVRKAKEEVQRKYGPKPKAKGYSGGNPFAMSSNPFALGAPSPKTQHTKQPKHKPQISGYVIVGGKAYPKAQAEPRPPADPKKKRDPLLDVGKAP